MPTNLEKQFQAWRRGDLSWIAPPLVLARKDFVNALSFAAPTMHVTQFTVSSEQQSGLQEYECPVEGMTEGRKQAVSIRLGASDLRNLRKLARRLGVRHSDLVRYAIKSTLARLAPLHESELRGKALVPVFVEAGAELMRYLDLDAGNVDAIINEGVPPELRVEREDVQLLAMSSMSHHYARLRLVSVGGARVASQPAAEGDPVSEDLLLTQSLRKYLYDKYVFDGGRQEVAALQGGGQVL